MHCSGPLLTGAPSATFGSSLPSDTTLSPSDYVCLSVWVAQSSFCGWRSGNGLGKVGQEPSPGSGPDIWLTFSPTHHIPNFSHTTFLTSHNLSLNMTLKCTFHFVLFSLNLDVLTDLTFLSIRHPNGKNFVFPQTFLQRASHRFQCEYKKTILNLVQRSA